jgi:hypothetical protein
LLVEKITAGSWQHCRNNRQDCRRCKGHAGKAGARQPPGSTRDSLVSQ